MGMRHVVVTGAGGFIGSHLCEALLARGDRVSGVDVFDTFYDPAVKRQNLVSCTDHEHFRLIESDIRDVDAMQAVLRDSVDVVVHLAARAGVRPSIAEPLVY